jgi:hypothetical protein
LSRLTDSFSIETGFDTRVEAEIDPTAIQSNSFPLEWPPRSGEVRHFPEVARAAWFDDVQTRRRSAPSAISGANTISGALAGPSGDGYHWVLWLRSLQAMRWQRVLAYKRYPSSEHRD